MRKLIEQTLSSTGLRQSALTIVGNTAATGISAIALIIISRLLGPTQFGEFSVGFAIVLMVSRLNDAGLSATLLKYTANEPDHKQANLVLSLTTRYKLVLSVMIVAIGLLLIPWLSQVLNFHHPDLLAASFIFGVVTVYYEQLLAALQSFHEFTKAVIVNAIQSATKLAAVFIFFVAGIHSSTLIFSTYMVAVL
jgi:O-antigen/teichoic acid export membrane protein